MAITEMTDKQESRKEVSRPSAAARVVVLAVLGVALSCYLIFHHVSIKGGFQREPAICDMGGVFNCSKVAESPYSEFLQIPIAGYGLFYYLWLLIFIALFRPLPRRSGHRPEWERDFGDSLFFLSMLSIPPTLILFGISHFAIGFICPFCALQYVLNIMLAFVTWRSRPRTAGVAASLANGLKQTAACFLPSLLSDEARPEKDRERVWGIWALTIATAVAVYFIPMFLVTQYFLPQELANRSENVLMQFVERWRQAPEQEIEVQTEASPLDKDFSIGPANAPITLVEFSDFQCPFCQRASHYFKAIANNPGSQVRVVFKNYPLDNSCNSAVEESHHLYACQAAIMARCAGLQGDDKFWRMHDALFSLSGLDWDMESLLALPDKVGLDRGQFDRCLGEQTVRERVIADVDLGNALGIQGTPTIFVNNRMLPFDRLEHLAGIIDLIRRTQIRENP